MYEGEFEKDFWRLVLELVRRSGRNTGLTHKDVKLIVGEDKKRYRHYLKLLERAGWIRWYMQRWRLVADLDEIAEEIAKQIKKKRIDIPFVCKVHSTKNAYMLAIPMYVVNAVGIEPGDLVVLRLDGVRISGKVSGKKRLVYISKRFWEKLNIGDKEEFEVVLEEVYKGRK